jgi:uncharacterized membrane protein YhiD involved in acid resistance
MGLIWQNKGDVEGLTTASILFSTVLIGFLIGLNFWFYAINCHYFSFYILGELKYWLSKENNHE